MEAPAQALAQVANLKRKYVGEDILVAPLTAPWLIASNSWGATRDNLIVPFSAGGSHINHLLIFPEQIKQK